MADSPAARSRWGASAADPAQIRGVGGVLELRGASYSFSSSSSSSNLATGSDGVSEYWCVGVLRQSGIAPRVRGVGSAFRGECSLWTYLGLKPQAESFHPFGMFTLPPPRAEGQL